MCSLPRSSCHEATESPQSWRRDVDENPVTVAAQALFRDGCRFDAASIALLDQLPVAGVVVDAAGNAMVCNAAARERLGSEPGTITLGSLRARSLEDPGRLHVRTAPGRTADGELFTWVVIGEARDDHEM